MRTTLIAALGFIIGVVIACIICIAGYIAFILITDFHDSMGALMMLVMFAIGPILGIIMGAATATLAVRRFA